MSKRQKLALLFLSPIFLVAAIYGAASLWAQGHISSPLKTQDEQSSLLRLEAGQGMISVINYLAANDLISHPQRTKLAYYISGMPTNLQRGTYEITADITLRQLIDNISNGRQKSYRVTADVGSRFQDFYAKLLEHPQVEKTTQGKDQAEIMQLLSTDYLGLADMPDLPNLEGMFYADTYFFYAGEKDITILQNAHDRLLNLLNDEWQRRAQGLSYENPYQALIMASIIEKETGVDSERYLISGVFHNRLDRGMRLQTDPTVIYGMGDRYQGNIRRRDLREATSYNTYVIYGLPPTPIALVDERAIRAALNPAPTDYIFFVAKGDGSHQFSVSLDDHNAAVRRYQLGR